MPDHLGDDMRKVKDDKEEPEKEIKCKCLYLVGCYFLLVELISSLIFL